MPGEFHGEKPAVDDLVKLCTRDWAELGRVISVEGFIKTKVTLLLKNSPDKPTSRVFNLYYVPNDWTFRKMMVIDSNNNLAFIIDTIDFQEAVEKVDSVDQQIRLNIVENLKINPSSIR